MRRVLFALCATLLLTAPAAAQRAPNAPDGDGPTNVILMIPDGFGPASVTMARDYLRWRDGTQELPYDSLHVGSTRTLSSSSRITDSAAGGTALATGTKTYNGAISVDSTRRPLGTILEGAERRGLATGLVVTSRLTHATPAVFSAHVPDRDQENEIARQQLNQDIEVLLGGGRRHFLPETMAGSARNDQRNLLDAAERKGYQVVETADGLAQVDDEPVLGLFSGGHMAYEIDRAQTRQPSLAAMTETAIDVLSDREAGYFLMVEGSRIDHAGHANDAAGHLHDILAFNEAVEAALDAANRDENTLVVVVSDHETGGLTLGRNRDGEGIYAWHPDRLAGVEASSAALADSVRAIRSSGADSTAVARRIADTVRRLTGVEEVPAERLRRLMAIEGQYALGKAVSPIVNRHALVGWTSYAHTAVDVGLYAYGPGANRFVGNHDNTYVAHALADLLGVDLGRLTRQMRADATSE
jgi:alkaline phosphatase